MTTWLILTRAVHFGACLLFFGIYAFDRLTAPALRRQPELAGYWETRLRFISLVLLPLILASGGAWFALVSMAMSGQPLQAEILKTVWTQTQFGIVWKIRLVILMIATIAAFFPRFIKSPPLFSKLTIWLQFILNGCLLGSLAWAGHGQESSPWHLFADVIHLLAAGIWPAGLIPLFLILRKSRQFAAAPDWFDVAALVRRFSVISLSAVSLLVITGMVNSWFLVGSFSNLFGQPYGHWLLAKIIMFCVILVIAAVNLLRLKPRLITESSQPGKARETAARLQTNIQIELFLGLAIVVTVAILGILPPAIH
jgi:copper resistance protein D